MGYIYCITNLINSKRYIGKTTSSIQDRWKQHCRDKNKRKCEKRPLYSAMDKYGIENFIVEELEYVEDDSLLQDKEIYWIKELNTYGSSGYNASKGGDGKLLYDHNEIIELAKLGYSEPQIAEKIQCSKDIVYKILKANNVKVRRNSAKLIAQFDLAGNYIQTFWGTRDAICWLNKVGIRISSPSQITRVCRNEQKEAHGYIWKYLPNPK